MILELAATAMFACGGGTKGASETAQWIENARQSQRQHLQNSYTPGIGRTESFTELTEIAELCRAEGWDGTDALPVAPATISHAQRFLSELPFGFSSPSLSADPEGHLSFEWYRSTRRVLSVSISPEGILHYAAIIGDSQRWGTEVFGDDVPATLLSLIHEVSAGIGLNAA